MKQLQLLDEDKECTKNKSFVMLHKQGKFYNCFNEDAIIMHYLFGYKIIKDNLTGFPETSLVKVLNKLESEKISYEIIYKDRDSVIKNYGNINKYKIILGKSLEYQKISERVKLIQDKVALIQDKEVLEKILKGIENGLW